MSHPQDVYHSPPQTPYSEHSDDNDLDSTASSSTVRITDSVSPVVISASSPHESILLPSHYPLKMSLEHISTSDSSSVSSFPNLSDDNWGTWFSAMESYFLIKDLDGILDESEPIPPPSDLVGSRNFAKRKKHIAGIIGLKLSDPIRELLVTDLNRRDPVALWNDIKAHFASTKARNRGRVFTKLFSLSCVGTEISDFITTAKKTLNELSSIGVHTDNEMIAHFLLHLLPAQLEAFKDMVIYTAEATDTPLAVNSVINLLQQHVNDKKTQISSSGPSTALAAVNNSSPSGPISRFKQPICVNGQHNPATQHTSSRCWQLHPELRNSRNPTAANSVLTASSANEVAHPTPPVMTTFLLAAFSKTSSKVETLLDSGASSPMFKEKDDLKTYSSHSEEVSLADGTLIKTEGQGSVDMKDTNSQLLLSNCLHIPSLAHNLISLSHLVKKGCQLYYIGNDKFEVRKDGKKVFGGFIRNGIFVLNVTIGKSSSSAQSARSSSDTSILLHRRLGHLNYGYLHKLFPSSASSSPEPCSTCILSKHHRLPFPGKLPRPSCLLEVIHSDLSGRISPASVNGYRYYFKLTDGYSKFKHIYLLKYKSETFKFFMEFKIMVEKQTGHKIKRLVNDNGGEYLDESFQSFLRDEGIIMDKTAAYTPQQNSISERGNRTTTERARCMLVDANLPKQLWAEAVTTAVYIENQSLEASIEFKTPHELWYNTKPDLSHLRIFGCAAYKLIPKQFRGSKFSPTSNKQILLGYQDRMHNYRLLNPTNGHVSYSHDVIFDETDFSHQLSLALRPSTSSTPDSLCEDLDLPPTEPLLTHDDNSLTTPMSSEESPTSPDSHESLNQDPTLPPHYISSSIDPRNIIEGRRRPRANAAVLPEPAPRTYKQAMSGPNQLGWEKAIQAELDNMKRHDVFSIVELPDGAKSVGTTWVFKDKWSPTGVFIKHKARLCAQGFTQVEGVDYDETYAPTGSKAALRALTAVAAEQDLEIHKMDAVAAFLNGVPKETIYLRVPQGFEIPGKTERTVLKVNKSIYGLKQSPRCWYDELRLFMISIDFRPSTADPCLFIKNDGSNPCYVHVHVDDMTIAGTRSSIQNFKTQISRRFEMEDLGEVSDILGMTIIRNRSARTLSLSQQGYVESLLKSYDMSNCKPVSTPMEPGTHLTPATDEELAEFAASGHNYRRAVGSLNYLVQCSRPDLAFASSQLSQYLDKPGTKHWAAFWRVLRYLRGTSDYSITFKGN